MNRLRASLVTAVAAASAAGGVRAADTPQQAYQHKLHCAALWAAGQAEAGPDRKPDAAKDAQSARDAAVAAGARVGLSPKRVTSDVDKARGQLLAETHQPDRAKAKKAESELGGQLLQCGLEGLRSGEIKAH